MMNAGTVKNVGREIGGMGVSITLGLVGGAICGAVILSFGALLGRSGTTGTEYVGYWDVGLVWVGFLYGGLFGMIVGPIGYATYVRKMGFQIAILPASIGTVVGGCIGAVAAPPVAVITGVLGFFLALVSTKSAIARRTAP